MTGLPETCSNKLEEKIMKFSAIDATVDCNLAYLLVTHKL